MGEKPPQQECDTLPKPLCRAVIKQQVDELRAVRLVDRIAEKRDDGAERGLVIL